MLEIKFLSVISLANMLSHAAGFLVVLLVVVLLWKAFYFDVVPFVYFLFSFHCPRSYISKDIALAYVWDFAAYGFLKIFMVSHLMFKSFIYFEFIFVLCSFCVVRWWCSFIFFTCICPIFPTPFIEETILTPLYVLASFVKY